MSVPPFPSKPEQRRFGGGCLFPILAVLGLMVISVVSTLAWQPERLARANACIGPYAGEPMFENTCQYDVNFQYCLYSKEGEARDICRTTLLEPGQGVTALQDDLNTVGGLLRPEIYACKAPFLPGRVRDTNNGRMKNGCTKPPAD